MNVGRSSVGDQGFALMPRPSAGLKAETKQAADENVAGLVEALLRNKY